MRYAEKLLKNEQLKCLIHCLCFLQRKKQEILYGVVVALGAMKPVHTVLLNRLAEIVTSYQKTLAGKNLSNWKQLSTSNVGLSF